VTELDPSTVTGYSGYHRDLHPDTTDSDDTCPGCGTTDGVQPKPAPPTVQAWTYAACGMHWCMTVVNPGLRAALDVIGLLPTPALRTAALLDVMRTDVRQRSAKECPVNDTVYLPVTELVNIDPMASVATAVWWCRLCGHKATATTRPTAHSDGIEHLTAQHHATIVRGNRSGSVGRRVRAGSPRRRTGPRRGRVNFRT
jgi:hypothetical protein